MSETLQNIQMKLKAEAIERKAKRAKIWAVLIIVLLTLLCIALAGAGAVAHFGPQLIENKINELLNSMSEKGKMDFQIKYINFHSAEVACTFKEESADANQAHRVGSIGAITIQYRPLELMKGKIESVELKNCDFLCTQTDEMSFKFPIYELFVKGFMKKDGGETSTSKNEPVSDLNKVIPVQVEKIIVSGNVILTILEEESVDLVYFAYRVHAETDSEEKWNKLKCDLAIHNASNSIRVQAEYRHKDKRLKISPGQINVSTNSLSRTIRNYLPRGLRGGINLTSEAELDLDTLSIQEGTSVSGKLNFSLRDQNKVYQLKVESPYLLQVKENGCFAFSLDELAAEYGGIPVEVSGIEGELSLPNHTVKGSFKTKIADSEAALFEIEGTTEPGYSKVTAALSNRPKFRLNYQGIQTGCIPEKLEVAFEHNREEESLNVTGIFKAKDLTAEQNGITGKIGDVMLEGTFAGKGTSKMMTANLGCNEIEGAFNGIKGNFERLNMYAQTHDFKKYAAETILSGMKVKMESPNLTYTAPEVKLNAQLNGGAVSGKAECAVSDLLMPDFKTAAIGINWSLPFEQTIAKSEKTEEEENEKPEDNEVIAEAEKPLQGKIGIKNVIYDGIETASADGKIGWTGKGLKLDSGIDVRGIKTNLKADMDLLGGVMMNGIFEIPEQELNLTEDIGVFFPQFENISCTGNVKGKVNCSFTPGKKPTGNAEINVHGMDVAFPEKKLEVKGIDLGFKVRDLATLKSEPGQLLTIQKIKFDKIETENCRVTFRMESPTTWQVENASMKWCGGHIRLGSLLLSKEYPLSEAIMYCDRLDLAEFLTQTGVGDIQGEGALNGTIPVYITPDSIYFDDAFLYSTPGEDGLIRGTVNENLMNENGGITMELSKDALKDFTYSWVRMSMATSGEKMDHLKITLSLDGKPNQPLYYSFDGKQNSFIKSSVPCRFQGIRLDVNVNITAEKIQDLVKYLKNMFSKQ